MESRTVKSTSRSSATTDDIVLRETGVTRLVFRPMLVDNKKDPSASVKGTFVFQKKGFNDNWEEIPVPSLSSLKKGDEVKLPLSSEELRTLFTEVSALYQLFESEGIPLGQTRFVKANETVQALAQMTDEEITTVMSGQESLGASAVARLIGWASDADNFSLMFDRLQRIGEGDLLKLNTALGIANIKRALKIWFDNRRNDDEEFWHTILAEQSFVLEQIFHVPIVVIKSKAYVGGKSVLNRGGKIVDFLVKNSVTSSVGLVEIKTPMTPLLGGEYRTGIYNVSSDLTGAVQQALCYRDSISRERTSLLREFPQSAEVFDPLCIVLIGNVRRELADDKEKQQAFELYRRQLSSIEIVTYDEMYDKMRRLVSVLESGA